MRNKNSKAMKIDGSVVQDESLTNYVSLLEGITRAELHTQYLHIAQLRRISAMARAIAKHHVPDGDRDALAAALCEACEQVERETRANLEALKFAIRSPRMLMETCADDLPWRNLRFDVNI